MHDIFIPSYRNGTVFTAHGKTFHSALLKEAADAGVLIKLGCQVTKVDFLEASVHLANGDVYKGDLVLTTGGEISRRRELMLVRPDSLYYSSTILFGLDIKQDDIHKYKDLRDIVDPPSVHFWYGPGTHRLGFSLNEDGLFHIISGASTPDTSNIQARPEPINMQELRDYHKEYDPFTIQQALGSRAIQPHVDVDCNV